MSLRPIDGLTVLPREAADDPDFLRTVLDHLHDGVYFVDPERRITFWNKAAEELTGWKSEEVVGRFCPDGILRHCSEAGEILCGAKCPLLAAMRDGVRHTASVYMQRRDGVRVPVRVQAAPVHTATGEVVGCVEVFSDASTQLAFLNEMTRLKNEAFFDPLTELANRRYIDEQLEAVRAEATRQGWPVSVLFIDIDGFKQLNDSYGHSVGDEALKNLATTLRLNVRPIDLVARWGGEEFVVIAPNVEHEALFAFADRLRALIGATSVPVAPGLAITVSIGAVTIGAGDSLAGAIEAADRLMYRSKSKGKNRVTA